MYCIVLYCIVLYCIVLYCSGAKSVNHEFKLSAFADDTIYFVKHEAAAKELKKLFFFPLLIFLKYVAFCTGLNLLTPIFCYPIL